jgi:hypothetical protein
MRLKHTLVAVAVIILAVTEYASGQTAGAGRFVAGEILVKFRPGASAAVQADTHRSGRRKNGRGNRAHRRAACGGGGGR